MDEIVVADVDAYVGQAGPVGVSESDQVARAEVSLGDLFAGGKLVGNQARHLEAGLVVDPLNQSGTVESTGSVAAPNVGLPDVGRRRRCDLLAKCGVGTNS